MPNVDGCLIIATDVPSFVVPVLLDRRNSNLSLIQQIDSDNRIASFFEIDVGNNYQNTPFALELNVGDEAIWGFRYLTGQISFRNFATLKKELEGKLLAREFANFPLIESQIAKFCENSVAYAGALSKSYELIQSRSKLAAAIWRDSSVLLPLARKEMARVLPKHLNSEVHGIRLIGTGTTILLELPRTLHDFVESHAIELRLSDTLAIGKVFGLNSYAFTGARAPNFSSPPESTFGEMYGELAPFTGIGDLVAQNSPSYSRVRRLIPPWIKKDSRPLAKRPLITFCVVNTDVETIGRALEFAKSRGRETIKIAIVTSPITFGTSKGHKADLNALGSLRPTFDYIFVIGNHVLQRPTGSAYRLAASSRAVKYVRACVNAIMQLIWSPGAPTTPKEFFAIFPRHGFGLVGRAIGNKDTPPEDILQEAVASALNERLPLHYGRRLLLVGPPSIVDNSHILSFLNQAADATLNETMSIISTNRRAAVTLLCFGIRPVEPTEHRHREFCLELLRSRRFSVLRDSEVVVHGEFAKGRTIAIGFAVSEASLSQVATMVRKTSIKTQCILTNFAPSISSVEYLWRLRVAVFHYSLLDTYLDRRMSLPPSLIERDNQR